MDEMPSKANQSHALGELALGDVICADGYNRKGPPLSQGYIFLGKFELEMVGACKEVQQIGKRNAVRVGVHVKPLLLPNAYR